MRTKSTVLLKGLWCFRLTWIICLLCNLYMSHCDINYTGISHSNFCLVFSLLFQVANFWKNRMDFFVCFLNGAQTNQINIELAHYKDRKQKYTLNYGTVHYIQTLVACRVCQLCKKYRVDAIETNCLCCCSAARFCPPANVCCRSYCVPLALVDFFCLTSMAELTTSTLKHHFFFHASLFSISCFGDVHRSINEV